MPFDGPYAGLMEQHGFIPANHAKPTFFPVKAHRLFDENGHELAGWKRTVREDTGRTLHVATDAYQIVTNEEAFGAFEAALEQSSLDLEGMRIGTDYANDGARVFRQYLLPAHTVEVKPGVSIALRLIMMNSYDGSLAFRGQAGFYNFVCANTSIFGTDLASFRMRHQGTLDVGKAAGGLAQAAEAHDVEARRMRHWPSVPVSDATARAVFGAMPQATPLLVDHLVHRWITARDEDALQGGANLWALWNVLTAWSTHAETKGQAKGQTRQEREGRVARLVAGPAFQKLALQAA